MFAGQEVGLGLIILAVVLFVSVLVMILLRRLPRNSLVAQNSSSTLIFPQATNSNESVLIVQPGGRIEYINDLGREWFGLRPDEPSDLERLIRRARPAEDLLNLLIKCQDHIRSCSSQCVLWNFQRILVRWAQIHRY
jgi:sensor histidine kinase regulating citrate/malate metabolism